MSISNIAIKFACFSSVLFSHLAGTFDWRPQPANSQQSSSFLLAQQQTTQTEPIGRSASGTTPRGDCPAMVADAPSLTVLTPLNKKSVTATLSQSPTFHFYSPYTKGTYHFKLVAVESENPDNTDNVVYEQDIPASKSVGIFALHLPNLPKLQAKKYYRWKLAYPCSKTFDGSLPPIEIYGLLYRRELTALQKQEFARAKNSTQRIAFYRRYKIWLELLDELAQSLPQSHQLWQQTLDAEGLQSISKFFPQ